MATSLVSTGVQFPDSTIQTTAAGAGGSSLDAIASGSLSNGSTVIVNADGTVSVVSATANPQTVGTAVVFASAAISTTGSGYDVANNKIVVSYVSAGVARVVVGTVSGTTITFGSPVTLLASGADEVFLIAYSSTDGKLIFTYKNTSDGYGRVRVGTVSGTSISFGTEVIFESSSTQSIAPVFDSTNNRVVISYRTSFGYSIVGTISGTNISFGTRVAFQSNSTDYVSATYDSVNNKVVVLYQYYNGSANVVHSIVGTVSGTSISFGTSVLVQSAATNRSAIAFNSVGAKVVVAYTGASNFLRSRVGTISGTSISFGTEAVISNASTERISLSYDIANDKNVLSYRNGSNLNYGTISVGTVSGTSISFGTPVVFESAETDFISSAYNSVDKKVVISYKDVANSSYGTSVVFQNDSTNLTDENFIGISSAAYTNGQTATIQLVGSVDDAQSGLTAGQKYYVQTNGTLGLSPASPSVLAGTAQSATKLIIKR